ncbi:MAG: hypothetical protein L6R45_11305 [Anaerolineae bacterium]|nr:hypothetical protein [Anaerolineae bacterium]
MTIYSSFSSSEQTNIQYGVLPPPGGGSSLWQYGIAVLPPKGRGPGDSFVPAYSANLKQVAALAGAGNIYERREDTPDQRLNHNTIIPGTTLGLYRVNGIGVATGPYKVGAAYATADKPDFLTQVFSGTTVLNQSYQFTFNMPLSISTYLPIILKEATGQSMITAPGGDDGASDSPFVSPVPTPTPAKKKVR